MSVKKFDLKGVLAAAGHFTQEPGQGATRIFNAAIRKVEGTKQSIKPKEVTIVSEDSIKEVFATLVHPHCLNKMVEVVIAKYQELGHTITEE